MCHCHPTDVPNGCHRLATPPGPVRLERYRIAEDLRKPIGPKDRRKNTISATCALAPKKGAGSTPARSEISSCLFGWDPPAWVLPVLPRRAPASAHLG